MKKIWYNISDGLPTNKGNDKKDVDNILVEFIDGGFDILFFGNGNFREYEAADIVPIAKIKRWCYIEVIAALH